MTGKAELLERQRILLLLKRDGRAAARAWVERTRRLYAQAMATPHSYAALPEYRPGFKASIRVFDAWLDDPGRVESGPGCNDMENPS